MFKPRHLFPEQSFITCREAYSPARPEGEVRLLADTTTPQAGILSCRKENMGQSAGRHVEDMETQYLACGWDFHAPGLCGKAYTHFPKYHWAIKGQ